MQNKTGSPYYKHASFLSNLQGLYHTHLNNGPFKYKWHLVTSITFKH